MQHCSYECAHRVILWPLHCVDRHMQTLAQQAPFLWIDSGCLAAWPADLIKLWQESLP